MKNEFSFEELTKEAIEASNKRYQDTFVRTHELLMKDMERRRNFVGAKVDMNVQLSSFETNLLLEKLNPFNQLVSKGMSNMRRKESEQIEYILRHWIDDPIKGEITKESLRERCIRTVLYKEPNEMDSEVKQSGDTLTFTITSGLLGVVQGDYLIGINGQRSLLTEEQNRRLLQMGV